MKSFRHTEKGSFLASRVCEPMVGRPPCKKYAASTLSSQGLGLVWPLSQSSTVSGLTPILRASCFGLNPIVLFFFGLSHGAFCLRIARACR